MILLGGGRFVYFEGFHEAGFGLGIVLEPGIDVGKVGEISGDIVMIVREAPPFYCEALF
jgi:hypothetical protein